MGQGKKIEGRWTEGRLDVMEDYREDSSVTGPTIIKDEIQAPIREMKSGK